MERGAVRKLVATVVKTGMNKGVIVQVERTVKDPTFKKYIHRRNKFAAHDESNECKLGDTVEIKESRPLSKQKRWRVTKVIKRLAIEE